MSGYAPVPTTEGFVNPFGYGQGYQDFIPLAAPAAGSNLLFTVEGRNWLRVLGARATINTDANVANRFVSLDFINARSTTYVRNAAGLVVTASTVNQRFEWSSQREDAQWALNTPVLLPVLPIFLPPGTGVQITLDSIQVGDTITAASLTVERFDTGSVGAPVGNVPDVTPSPVELQPQIVT